MVDWKNDQKWHCGPTKKYQRRPYCRSVTEFTVRWGAAPQMFAEWLGRTVGGGVADTAIRVGGYTFPLLFSCLFSWLCLWPCSSPSFHMELCKHLLRDAEMNETQFLPSRKSQSDGRNKSRTGNVYIFCFAWKLILIKLLEITGVERPYYTHTWVVIFIIVKEYLLYLISFIVPVNLKVY